MSGLLRIAAIVVIVGAAITGVGLHHLSVRGSNQPSKDQHAHDKHGHQHEGGIELSDAKVATAGIELIQAGPGSLRETLRLNGIIQPNQETLVQVTPRFPGVVREVRKRLGDSVRKDEVLAVVESNQSLTTFELRAPLEGTVIERQVALGEHVSEQKPAFVVANLSTVWIDFSVYKRDLGRVRVGDQVQIDPEDGGPLLDSRIAYVSPLGASDTQSSLARVVVANDGRLRPGLFVTGRLLIAEKRVDIAIKLSALQTIEGRTVVFVRSGSKFEVREVELGSRDSEKVEVVFGLLPGDVYAANNSFVIKSELAKGSAAHEH